LAKWGDLVTKISDINKQVWKFQEGLAFLSLSKMITPAKVYWNYDRSLTPVGMSIDPDIIIGDKPDAPNAILFVTHGFSAKESNRKFWRTVAEVLEVKRLSFNPRALSIMYSGYVKGNLLETYKVLFDGVYHLDETREGKIISDYLMELTQLYGHLDPKNCLDILNDQISQEKVPYWEEFCEEISVLEQKTVGFNNPIVSLFTSHKTWVPNARRTSFRRSACKLLTLPSEIRESLIAKKRTKVIPHHAVLLGWVKETIGGYQLCDTELLDFIDECNPEIINYVIAYAKKNIPVLNQYISSLSMTDTLLICINWIIENYNILCNPSQMASSLLTVFENPSAPLISTVTEDKCPKHHWLFEMIMLLLRLDTGRKDGFGYSVLARDTGIARVDLAITTFVNRKKSLDLNTLELVSIALSKRLRELGILRCRALSEDLLRGTCESIFNFKIASYRHYNPIEWLVCKLLSDHGHSFNFPTTHKSFLSMDSRGSTTDTENMISVDDGEVWIKCQSAYDGRIDKRKELCGRIGAMKLVYDNETIFGKSFFLVVDGFFNQEDLILLSKAGWDGIFYYNELEQLIEAVHSSLKK
jgi:hypothetical protein